MTSPHSTPRPFATAPDPCRYFPASAMEEARQRIGRSILRGEGPVLVIGAAGLGKTMLLEVVAQQFREQFRAVLLAGGQLCTRRALLQMILFQLDLPYQGMDESELRLSLLSYLQPQNAEARRILLLVDEADALPPRLLEELRALTNLSEAGQLLVNLVMAGNSTLEEQFADPKLDLFSQRISARCYLTAFGREETFQFVQAQVAAGDTDPNTLFTEDSLEAIFAATDGVPRLINQLGDQLLWMVSETGYAPLDGMIVQQAWSELQQLPAPWNTQSNEPVGTPIEYGELDIDENTFGEPSQMEGHYDESGFEQDRYEQEGFSDDFEDDLPASIPINSPQLACEDFEETTTVELSSSETMDVTEHLLDQLQVMGTSQVEPKPSDSTADTQARNPFSEKFESEEIVLDQYSTFESLILAEAPKVANRSDSGFAQQLQKLEVCESAVIDLQTSLTVETAEPESLPLTSEEPTAHAFASTESDEKFGEVLIIEENEAPQTAVVNGQKFRQLFSSLESGGGESCFG